MKIAEIVSPSLPAPVSTELTWEQTWRYMAIGIFRAGLWSSLPLATYVWNWRLWQVAFPWHEFFQLAGSIWGPTAARYWWKHRQQLKLPAAFNLPEDWEVQHVEATVTQTNSAGTTVTQIDHTQTVDVKSGEPVKDSDPKSEG